MQNLIEHMAEIELGRFSVNGYRGLPDAPPFSVVEGKLPVIVSAPHAVSQLREGHVPPGEAIPFTSDQIPIELEARRNPDPACVEATMRALADLGGHARKCVTLGTGQMSCLWHW